MNVTLEILKIIFPVLLFAAIMAAQYFLSRTGNKLIGLIIPIITVIVMVYLHVTGFLQLKLIGTIILTVIALLFLLGQWNNAQKDNKEKAKNEMNKMKSKDLK
ncbi:hypothetical protein BUY49_11285 [Staphylococcus devriesei]|uniref:hypothetical protein n=1 Tax=Staphylococcus devriesei TaxID=586733 RepID=UPI000E6A8C00|nr:hypothetical protein [Staphylococcus devriesei]RIL69382.1 hypothetical protein BUY49_11285 [Staphylococcus devriesei]